MGMKRTDANLRLAIISTPRTGNNWLQHLLSHVYDLPRLSPVNVPNVNWSALPPSCVMILHWRRDPAVLELLERHRFQVVSMARHPLDVLVSILHYTLREPTSGWLQEEAGGERAILGLSPCSSGFIDYAVGPRAAALLSVTTAWWQDPRCHRVHYEDLVRDPQEVMQKLVERLGVPCRNLIADAVAASTLPRLRDQFPQRAYHFWQGQPDLWKALVPGPAAARIVHAHGECFSILGYSCVPDLKLSHAQAEANWKGLLDLPEHGDPVVPTLQRALDEVQRDLEQTRARLAALDAAGPASLRIALRFRNWAARFPRLTGAMKKWFVREAIS
jgi:Sulfotransferase domain